MIMIIIEIMIITIILIITIIVVIPVLENLVRQRRLSCGPMPNMIQQSPAGRRKRGNGF